jgi:hypothetical protein
LTKSEAFKVLKNANWKTVEVNGGENVYLRATYKGKKVELRDDETLLYVNGKEAYDVGGTDEYESLFGMFWGFC